MLNIINRFAFTKIKKEGAGSAVVDYFIGTPVVSLADGLTKDIQKAYQGNLTFENSKMLKFVPFGKDVKFINKVLDK